ncbi:MAG: hypothetical protein JSV88_13825, partial [Candidatus Aminicenantes bacterium]
MDELEILDLIKKGESSKVQFKEMVTEKLVIVRSTIRDLDIKAFKKCLYRKYNERLTTLNFTLEQLLKLSIEEIFKKLDLNLSLNRV